MSGSETEGLQRGRTRRQNLLALVLALGVLLMLQWFASRQPPRGDPYSPSIPLLGASWWTSPVEVNRFNRPVEPTVSTSFRSIHFLPDGQLGWASGENGTILSTRDGGQNWQVQISGVKGGLASVFFLADGQRGWALGYAGSLLTTRDGGRTWRPQTLGIDLPVRHPAEVRTSRAPVVTPTPNPGPPSTAK